MNHPRIKTDTSARASTIRGIAARLVSDLFNPLFIPPAVFLLLGWALSMSASGMWILALTALLFYTFIPLGITLYLLRTGHIQSLDVPDQQSRNKLFVYSIISSSIGGGTISLLCIKGYPYLAMAAIVFLINPIAGYLINLAWKISIHTAALTSAGTVFLFLYQILSPLGYHSTAVLSLLVLLVLLPLMIWARYHLNVHSLPELWGGAVAGIIFTTIEMGLMLWIWIW